MENQFSMKELYDIKLKATYPIEINGIKYEEGEVITYFDKLQIANFNEIKPRYAAEGGFDNRAHVIWEDTKQIDFTFSNGIFSKLQFAMLSNSRLLTKEKGESILISQREKKETDDTGTLKLDNEPVGKIFVYELNTGEKITNFEQQGNTLVLQKPYTDIIIDYKYQYTNKSTRMILGQRLIPGYVFLEGRTRVKDDITGKTKTGIIEIPKLKLMSDLSIRLGEDANPVVANFRASGFPIGTKGSKEVMKITFLEDDIDSDM